MKRIYQECIDYINIWIQPFDSFKSFEWLLLKQNQELQFENITDCIVFLRTKGIFIDDIKLFEEFCLLKNFLKTRQNDFYGELAEKQWVIFYNACNDITRVSELLKICQYFFCIMPHNANCERIFSVMTSQWTKERNRLSVESIRAILLTQYNLKHFTCEEFYNTICGEFNFLKAVASGQKYKLK